MARPAHRRQPARCANTGRLVSVAWSLRSAAPPEVCRFACVPAQPWWHEPSWCPKRGQVPGWHVCDQIWGGGQTHRGPRAATRRQDRPASSGTKQGPLTRIIRKKDRLFGGHLWGCSCRRTPGTSGERIPPPRGDPFHKHPQKGTMSDHSISGQTLRPARASPKGRG